MKKVIKVGLITLNMFMFGAIPALAQKTEDVVIFGKKCIVTNPLSFTHKEKTAVCENTSHPVKKQDCFDNLSKQNGETVFADLSKRLKANIGMKETIDPNEYIIEEMGSKPRSLHFCEDIVPVRPCDNTLVVDKEQFQRIKNKLPPNKVRCVAAYEDKYQLFIRSRKYDGISGRVIFANKDDAINFDDSKIFSITLKKTFFSIITKSDNLGLNGVGNEYNIYEYDAAGTKAAQAAAEREKANEIKMINERENAEQQRKAEEATAAERKVEQAAAEAKAKGMEAVAKWSKNMGGSNATFTLSEASKLCKGAFRLPTNSDWENLQKAMNGGGKGLFKELYNTFTSSQKETGSWWSATQDGSSSTYWSVYEDGGFSSGGTYDGDQKESVRCVKK